MDSNEAMHDANNPVSTDGDFYIEEIGMEDDIMDDYDDVSGTLSEVSDDDDFLDQTNCTVLSEDDIHQRQEEYISMTSSVLSISTGSACNILLYYEWDVLKAHDAWFANEGRVRKTIGFYENCGVLTNSRELYCQLCFEVYPHYGMCAASCGHYFCLTCWRGYVSTSINDGSGCLMLRCPGSMCRAAVDQNMIDMLANDEDREKYSRYLLRSYVEDNIATKWCPFPDCKYAVEFFVGSSRFDVTCNCSYSFCWNCTEEAHRPVDCSTVSKWILKNSSQSENTKWLLANSKPCPKCKRPIEKNQGCSHMTCTPPCMFEFCWLCLGKWSNHDCNRYINAKKKAMYDEGEKREDMEENSLEKYTHYYQRWAMNHSSKKKALEDLHKMVSMGLTKLSETQNQCDLLFVMDAWLQIVECRQFLKWTYTYGYYLPDNEHRKRELFEYLQGEAESRLERLHHCTESELRNLMDSTVSSEEIMLFRAKLVNLTSVTQRYFRNLVNALETGLVETGLDVVKTGLYVVETRLDVVEHGVSKPLTPTTGGNKFQLAKRLKKVARKVACGVHS